MYLVQQGLRMIDLSISLPVAIQNRRYLPMLLFCMLNYRLMYCSMGLYIAMLVFQHFLYTGILVPCVLYSSYIWLMKVIDTCNLYVYTSNNNAYHVSCLLDYIFWLRRILCCHSFVLLRLALAKARNWDSISRDTLYININIRYVVWLSFYPLTTIESTYV